MSATPAQLKARLVDLYELISGIVTVTDDWPQDNKPFAISELPAVVIQMGRASNEKQSASNFLMTRPYYAILLTARIPNEVKVPDAETLASVDPFLVSVPRFFMAHQRLELNDAGLITFPVLPTDTAPGRFAFRGATYIRTVFTHEITTRHTAT